MLYSLLQKHTKETPIQNLPTYFVAASLSHASVNPDLNARVQIEQAFIGSKWNTIPCLKVSFSRQLADTLRWELKQYPEAIRVFESVSRLNEFEGWQFKLNGGLNAAILKDAHIKARLDRPR